MVVRLFLVSSLASIFPLASSQSQILNPQLYFGGNDNQAYLDWSKKPSLGYTSSLFLPSKSDPSAGVAIHWQVEGPDENNLERNGTLSLAVVTKATGWVSFGLSENGGMFGSDVVAFEAARPEELRDMHILDQYSAIEDECNDWKLVSSRTKGGFLIFEATRALNTGDTQDRAIIYDRDELVVSTRLIAAWGDDDSLGYHGRNVALGAIRWFGSGAEDNEMVKVSSFSESVQAFTKRMEQESVGFFEVRAGNHTLDPVDTRYEHFCLSRSQILAQIVGLPEGSEQFTIVGIEPIVDSANAQYVHHFTVLTSDEANDGNGPLECGEENYITMVYVWGPGETGFAFPNNVGVDFSSTSIQSISLQIHYDNPNLSAGVVDNSGVRFYYTFKPREHEMGILQIGDAFLRLDGQPVGEGLSEHQFECPSGCSTSVLKGQNVTVMREYLHMHKTGVRTAIQHFRKGKIIRDHAIDFFDFSQQGNQAIRQQPFQIMPDDGFRFTCNYDGAKDTTFGISSSEEMCMTFLFYWPRQKFFGGFPWVCTHGISQLGQCNAKYESKMLPSKEDLNRTFGLVPTNGQCPKTDIGSESDPSDTAGPTDSSSRAFGLSVSSVLYFVTWVVFAAWY